MIALKFKIIFLDREVLRIIFSDAFIKAAGAVFFIGYGSTFKGFQGFDDPTNFIMVFSLQVFFTIFNPYV